MQRHRAADPEIERDDDQVKGEDLDRLAVAEEWIQQLLGSEKSLIHLANTNPHTPQEQAGIEDGDDDRVCSHRR